MTGDEEVSPIQDSTELGDSRLCCSRGPSLAFCEAFSILDSSEFKGGRDKQWKTFRLFLITRCAQEAKDVLAAWGCLSTVLEHTKLHS